MAQLRESTTIGGSIAITAKNIHEYLDNVVIEGVGGGLELNNHTFEEYVTIHNITDLDQLSTTKDTGLYLTSGGITNPPVALYGSITLPPILTGAYWKPKMFEVDTSYFLTKSPMSDASIILIFNRSNKPTTKDMIILCYHLRTNVWYQMEQNPSTGKFSKKWEVKREIEREFRAFDKVEGALKVLSDKLAQTDKNVGVHGTRLTNVEALAVENKNETIAIRKDVVPKSDVVQTIGTSTSRVMSQKAIRDYTDSVGNTTGKFMREGAFGVGVGITKDNVNPDNEWGGFMNLHMASVDQDAPKGTLRYHSLLSFNTKLSSYRSQIQVGLDRMWIRGASTEWHEILSESNTTTDKNNVLYSGTTKPLDSLNTSNIVTTTGTSTVNAMSQKTVTDELNKKITGGSVQQGVGTSTVNVMSQKATTDQLKTKWDIVTNTGYAPNKNIDDYVAGEGGYSRIENGAPLEGLDIVTKSQYGTTDLLQIGFPQGENKTLLMRTKSSDQGGWGDWFGFYHSANTTPDKYGFLRAHGYLNSLVESDRTSSLGTSTTLVASQKLVNDVSIRTTTAQTRADNAWTLGNNALAKAQNLKDLTNVTTARTNLGLGSSATLNFTNVQGTTNNLLATQKLVNDVKAELNTEIGKKVNTNEFDTKVASYISKNTTDEYGDSKSLLASQALASKLNTEIRSLDATIAEFESQIDEINKTVH